MKEVIDKTPKVLIQHTAYGEFFIHNDLNHVWDGAEWRGFGEAERYNSFQEAFIARRDAVAAIPAA
ncbi:hypothetical protein [Mesorhizobium sp.]|uniref:hypothetical protein n=1 Tax=Mesorhizobium sp. TaxID=1871066 RepID=UPI0012191819|nr:hypothetical protein [Mesorhizobium sp.]TIN82218.1 MAG: hypothetical protein E5X97_31185 [Mesorhizobium sp.]